jgi:hypothetical protein
MEQPKKQANKFYKSNNKQGEMLLSLKNKPNKFNKEEIMKYLLVVLCNSI